MSHELLEVKEVQEDSEPSYIVQNICTVYRVLFVEILNILVVLELISRILSCFINFVFFGLNDVFGACRVFKNKSIYQVLIIESGLYSLLFEYP